MGDLSLYLDVIFTDPVDIVFDKELKEILKFSKLKNNVDYERSFIYLEDITGFKETKVL